MNVVCEGCSAAFEMEPDTARARIRSKKSACLRCGAPLMFPLAGLEPEITPLREGKAEGTVVFVEKAPLLAQPPPRRARPTGKPSVREVLSQDVAEMPAFHKMRPILGALAIALALIVGGAVFVARRDTADSSTASESAGRQVSSVRAARLEVKALVIAGSLLLVGMRWFRSGS
jgi:hypothetical protein